MNIRELLTRVKVHRTKKSEAFVASLGSAPRLLHLPPKRQIEIEIN